MELDSFLRCLFCSLNLLAVNVQDELRCVGVFEVEDAVADGGGGMY